MGLISRDSAATFLRTRFHGGSEPVTAVGGTSLATPAFPCLFFRHLVNSTSSREPGKEANGILLQKRVLLAHLGGEIGLVTGKPSVGAHKPATVTAQAAKTFDCRNRDQRQTLLLQNI